MKELLEKGPGIENLYKNPTGQEETCEHKNMKQEVNMSALKKEMKAKLVGNNMFLQALYDIIDNNTIEPAPLENTCEVNYMEETLEQIMDRYRDWYSGGIPSMENSIQEIKNSFETDEERRGKLLRIDVLERLIEELKKTEEPPEPGYNPTEDMYAEDIGPPEGDE